MTDNELRLIDRIAVIKTAQEKFDLENKGYLSFSGGKDSTILHFLLDEALPGNRIPRVYINTGIEYQDVVNFVRNRASQDKRIKIINPQRSIKKTLQEDGYPFKSKEHSRRLRVYQHSGAEGKTIKHYLEHGPFRCPEKLRYQFTSEFGLKISDKCCFRLKKEPAKKWMTENGRTITLTGRRKAEGGRRSKIQTCIITNKDGKVEKFHPLLVVNDDFEEWYVKERNISLCRLYYPPFNFMRTGCKGCPFNLRLQDDLDIMAELLPNERKQCEIIWKPIYEEYRRIGFRLRREDYEDKDQMKLFD